MKKFLTLMLFAVSMAIGANAQSRDYNGKLTGTAPDTVAGGAADTVVLAVKGSKSAVTFQHIVTKISGTLAGTIKVFGSIDGGVTYGTTVLNTYTLTDASSVGQYSVDYNGYTHYKVIIAPTGTNSASYHIWALYRE